MFSYTISVDVHVIGGQSRKPAALKDITVLEILTEVPNQKVCMFKGFYRFLAKKIFEHLDDISKSLQGFFDVRIKCKQFLQ